MSPFIFFKKHSMTIEEKAISYCPDDAYPFAPAILNKLIREAFVAGYNLCREEAEEKTVEMGQL